MTTSKIDPERSIDSDAYRGRVSDREEITPGKRRAMPLRTACVAQRKSHTKFEKIRKHDTMKNE